MAQTNRRRKYSSNTYERLSYGAYDGSAARQLEQGAEIRQPRPAVRPRKPPVSRPKFEVREVGSISAFAIAGFFAIGVFAVLLLFSYVQLHNVSEEIVSLRSEMGELQTQEAVLRAKYEQVYDLGAIEEAMLSTGRMVKPQNGQIIYIDLSEPDSVTFFDRETAVSGAEGAVESFRSICSRILEYFK